MKNKEKKNKVINRGNGANPFQTGVSEELAGQKTARKSPRKKAKNQRRKTEKKSPKKPKINLENNNKNEQPKPNSKCPKQARKTDKNKCVNR